MPQQVPFWSVSDADILKQLNTTTNGLTDDEAAKRKAAAPGEKTISPLAQDIRLFVGQFKNPITLLLLFGLVLSAIVGEFTNSAIILSILLLSGLLGFVQERNAGKAVEKLRSLIQTKTSVKRAGMVKEVPIDAVVTGDIVTLKAGDIVPADSYLLASKDLYVNESALTGESFPAEKAVGVLPAGTPLIQRKNALYKGTSVVSGEGQAVAVHTGRDTEIGKIATDISGASEETAFEAGFRKFGYMLMRIALLLAVAILVINLALGKPVLDSILFALALSLGLAPELLPAIQTITLSAGAKRLAAKKVIVKKLSSIHNLGSVDVFCSDKTGTLTQGLVEVNSCMTADGQPDKSIDKYVYLNAFFESGYSNPIDDAIRESLKCDITCYTKFDEVPYDFLRRRLSIVVSKDNVHTMITKGAVSNVLEVCDKARMSNGNVVPLDAYKDVVQKQYQQMSAGGYRTIGVAIKDVTDDPVINKDDETGMTFLGFITLHDPIKPGIKQTIDDLRSKKICLKILTGDNVLIAESIGREIGIDASRILSGKDMLQMTDDAILQKVDDVDIFAEIEPAQKEKIIHILQQKGHVVGYMGDGINDAPALKMADVGISVNNAVDVAKESADMILLETGLGVIGDGIIEGRKTYLNTLKYIFIAVSANFGNMFSMAGASILLPFLPLLPSQILLMNFLSDFPALAIASDNVDEELLQAPRKWNLKLIKNFMVVFGLESSVFDFVTFFVLIKLYHADAPVFRTGWFIESVVSAILILMIIRTRRFFLSSLPGKYLMIAGITVMALVIAIPYIPLLSALGFTHLSGRILLAMLGVVLLYGTFGEITKKILFKKMNY